MKAKNGNTVKELLRHTTSGELMRHVYVINKGWFGWNPIFKVYNSTVNYQQLQLSDIRAIAWDAIPDHRRLPPVEWQVIEYVKPWTYHRAVLPESQGMDWVMIEVAIGYLFKMLQDDQEQIDWNYIQQVADSIILALGEQPHSYEFDIHQYLTKRCVYVTYKSDYVPYDQRPKERGDKWANCQMIEFDCSNSHPIVVLQQDFSYEIEYGEVIRKSGVV